ncbi:hypothetical protein M8J71_15500 [Pseudarthrobacter sp. R1]|uniref:hypothetical protein n=1 Tax=Pseudarthrobacter sp. R1 TaxID=2944934 RepID=UPI00210CACD7|nr:hypothetical protein [Pseudarthrobacter sp. R1]MCQ6271882.1 hypothetical protein [Pseudarthrobacter sp. R1]
MSGAPPTCRTGGPAVSGAVALASALTVVGWVLLLLAGGAAAFVHRRTVPRTAPIALSSFLSRK